MIQNHQNKPSHPRHDRCGWALFFRSRTAAVIVALLSTMAFAPAFGQTEMKRNRGESFYRCLSSNTEGSGNIWLFATAIGHVWDNSPLDLSRAGIAHKGHWISNARAFPEVKFVAGLSEFAQATLESRPLTWAFAVPGWAAADIKCTWPNNKQLRLFGFGLDCKYLYNFTNSTPTLGGYAGFMPEGYVAKGSVFEGRLLFDLDCIARFSALPFRAYLNVGARLPLAALYKENYQFLGDAGLAYSGYAYDFFAAYSVEAFNNFAGPKIFTNPDGKRFVVWFRENPMYVVLGGNVRRKNGTTLSVAVPLLVSANVGSKMTSEDLTALNRNTPENVARFPYEMSHGIKDPFDPWFVKWKISVTLSVPLRYTMTSAEMMRNFLLLKNTRQRNRLDIDTRLREIEKPAAPEPAIDTTDTEKRLEEIRKRKAELERQE
jgi:hypothetical protein